MEKNIFENAKFGDKFLTREGRIALFNHKMTENGFGLIIEGTDTLYYNSDGTYKITKNQKSDCDMDIVSRYQEPIDEKKLEELAYAHIGQIVPKTVDEKIDLWLSLNDILRKEYISFKAGYRKAKEE